MFWTTKLLTWTYTMLGYLLAALDSAVATPLFQGAQVHLYTNIITPSPSSVPGDFVEATYNGYTATAVGALSGDVRIGSNAISRLANYFFGVTSPGGTSDTVYGYWVSNAANTVVLCAERFTSPAGMANPGDFIDLTLSLPLAAQQQGS